MSPSDRAGNPRRRSAADAAASAVANLGARAPVAYRGRTGRRTRAGGAARRPHGADSYMLLGDALLARGDRDGAREAWQRALRIHPRHRGVRFRLGRSASRD